MNRIPGERKQRIHKVCKGSHSWTKESGVLLKVRTRSEKVLRQMEYKFSCFLRIVGRKILK